LCVYRLDKMGTTESGECLDIAGFKDEKGYDCVYWKQHVCERAVEDLVYTSEGQAAIITNCCATCKSSTGGAESHGDEAHLIDILNSYTAKNEELEKQNEQLKIDAGSDSTKLQDELQKMKDMLAQKDKELEEKGTQLSEEEARIARLKLQARLHDAEAKLLVDSQRATTLIEGNLLKFLKGGKGKPTAKKVEVMERSGEIVENGWTPGQLILSYAETPTEMTRMHITKVIDGAEAVRGSDYDGRTFSLVTEPNAKVIAFACESADDKAKWFKTLSDAMERFEKETRNMNSIFTFTMEFKERPLGFRVEERFLTGNDGKEVEVLMVTKIQDTHEHLRKQGLVEGLVVTACNDIDFIPLTYAKKLEIIKGTEYPLKLTFEGKKYLRNSQANPETSNTRDVSMQILYPELFAALTTEGSDVREELYNHPLVQSNPEIKQWLDRPDFKELFQELMSDPDKLRDFLMNKHL